jgi:protein involved in sex pheromone biosynthesis
MTAIKKCIGIVTVSLILSGCAATFDNNEYSRLVDMRSDLREEQCADTDTAKTMVRKAVKDAEWLMVYSRHLPSNSNTQAMLDAYYPGVKEFAEAYDRTTPSVVFCRLKVRNLTDQLDIMLSTTARRPR